MKILFVLTLITISCAQHSWFSKVKEKSNTDKLNALKLSLPNNFLQAYDIPNREMTDTIFNDIHFFDLNSDKYDDYIINGYIVGNTNPELFLFTYDQEAQKYKQIFYASGTLIKIDFHKPDRSIKLEYSNKKSCERKHDYLYKVEIDELGNIKSTEIVI